ncbi:hypothetical protein [Tessaracoccus flavus]|uniref:hypothetical protein n=1 Tax=Tessaracoccus flavus TaxID=1610493 RepID=UPI00089D3AA6|nr:hypothetical protein [Tessaracoccus flavus]SDZ16813.1 hypothetical protein SAMN05428934_11342 [Tessaracoccus flavus]
MIWVAVVGGLALAGLVALVVYGLQIAHKVTDLRHEINVVAGRGQEIAHLVGQVQLPAHLRD